MDEGIAAIITGVLGLLTGTVGFYIANRYLEKNKQDISTKREQLQSVFAPLEILLKMNKREFDRYNKEDTELEDKEFIEKNVWYPNNVEVKRIIMERSHLFVSFPALLSAVHALSEAARPLARHAVAIMRLIFNRLASAGYFSQDCVCLLCRDSFECAAVDRH
jgi:uncharacterized membrane-anchored protein